MNLANTAHKPLGDTSFEMRESEDDLNRAIDELRNMAGVDAMKHASLRGNANIGRNVTMQIPVEVNIILGTAEMSVAELTSLQAGSLIQLDRRIGEPVDVVVNGIKIAQGEITLLEKEPNRFGFRITDILG